MTAIAEKLDERIARWTPETASAVEALVSGIIELADGDALDLLPARHVVQEVLDALDET